MGTILKSAGLLKGGIELGSLSIIANEQNNKNNDYLGENAINSVFNTKSVNIQKNKYSNFFWNYEYIIFGVAVIILIIYLKR